MPGGVVFIIIVPTENHEKSLKKSKFFIGNAEDFEYINIDVHSSQEKLIQSTADNSSNNLSKKSPLNKSKSVDLLSFEEMPNYKKPVHKSWAGIEALSVLDNSNDDNPNYSNMPLEKVLKIILKRQSIENAIWLNKQNKNFIQVTFPLEAGSQCEGTLAVLNEYGIGQRLNSIVSVIPCTLYYKGFGDSFSPQLREEEKQPEIRKDHNAKNSAWNTFVSSVRSRLTVAQVVEGVRSNAILTFDFLVLLLVATIISAIALAESNNVYLVSSMLISPMMGPVMAGTFGSVIQDRKLQKTGVMNELIGLGIATAVGFCYGVLICSFSDKYGINEWPSKEMVSRGEVRTLWVGCLIALLSGAAVALGILGDNIASLVGVAISTSLMPPAVNAGLLWAMSAVYAYCGEDSRKSLVRTQFYSTNEVYELAALGGISMCLTFVNIVCIYLAAILVFKIKEVAPLSSRDQSRRFWKYDIKIARDYNKTLQNEDANNVRKLLKNEIQSFNENKFTNQVENFNDLADHLYQSTEVTSDNHIIDVGRTQHTWSPSTFAPKRPSIKELKHLYFSLTDHKPRIQRQLNFKIPLLRPNHPSWQSGSHTFAQGDEGTLPCIPENIISEESGSNRFTLSGTRKFVVTPAYLDDTKNIEDK